MQTAQPTNPTIARDSLEAAPIDVRNLAHKLTALSTSQGDREDLQAALCLSAKVADQLAGDLEQIAR